MSKPHRHQKQAGILTKITNGIGRFFQVIGLLIGLGGIVCVFTNLWLGIFLIIVGGFFINIYTITPIGKDEVKKTQQETSKRQQEQDLSVAQRQKEDENARNNLFETFLKLPESFDLEVLDESLTKITKLNNDQRGEVAKILLALLKEYSLNDDIRSSLFKGLQQAVSYVLGTPNQVSTEQVYQTALTLLEQHPKNAKLRAFALEVGRWHIAPKKFLKNLAGIHSASDEQAILNDILIRTS